MNNLLMCGFMGCGKTTVGRLLALKLDQAYLDLDEVIAFRAGMPVSLIFEEEGEECFRELEHQAICALREWTDCVVSTGGGALTFARNQEAVDKDDAVIYLDVPFSVCYERIRDSDRPIVRRSTREELEAIYQSRIPLYRKAAKITVQGDASPEEVVSRILKCLGRNPEDL